MKSWNEISTDEAYRLDQARFQGMTIQALQDLQNDVKDLQQNNSVRGYISYAISAFIGGLAGLLAAGMKR